ncbi:hypothetical protein H9P43_009107 [Blastocladiella emersonii ATCC 22665]|nr:hypothetical protein H9P43_009107 [Blastocladiella emersonii ATCC 22665]
MAASFIVALLACLIAYRAMARHDLYSRHFGYSALLRIGYHLTRGIPKLMYTVLSTSGGAANSTWVIFGSRMLYATFVLHIDDFMFGAFGNPTMWGTFYTRIGEAPVTTCAIMNYINDATDLLVYMPGNIIMTSLKDSIGEIDAAAPNSHFTAQPVATGKAAKLQLLAFDLRLQLARSEMMLIARIGAILIYL